MDENVEDCEIDERFEMQRIRSLAIINAEKVVNLTWKRAYLRLADAADAIDAMVARTIDITDDEPEENK